MSTSTPETPECFVIMPLSDHADYRSGHFTRVFEQIFQPACETAGFKAINASQVGQTNLIHLDVLERLLKSPMVLCDLSTHNPNVLFELGLRQAFDKPVVLVQEEGTPSIFDIGPLRYTEYRNGLFYEEVLADQQTLARTLTLTKDACNGKNGVNSIVRLLSLTEAASLKEVQIGEEDPSLQIIRAEISSLRTEFRDALLLKKETPSMKFSHTIRDEANRVRKSVIPGKAANYMLKYGLENYLMDIYDVDQESIKSALKDTRNAVEFINNLAQSSTWEPEAFIEIVCELHRTGKEKELFSKLKLQYSEPA